jgi:hypothetical protein
VTSLSDRDRDQKSAPTSISQIKTGIETNTILLSLILRYTTMRITTLLLVLLASVSQLAVSFAEPADGVARPQQEQDVDQAPDDGVRTSSEALRLLRGKKTGGTTTKKCGNKKGCPTPSPTPQKSTSCPAVSPVLSGGGSDMTCDSKGKKCSFEYESTPPGAICQNKDDCTCSKQGKWVCTYQATCIDDSPMYIETCPEVSPIVSKITACLDNSKQLCEYKYNTPMPEIPEGTCEHKDVCSCNAQWQWACQGSTKCSIPYDRP